MELRWHLESWYEEDMRRAFVGIAQQNELLTLLPERPETTPFLRRRAERMKAVCFWAVIDQSIAATIVDELDAGASHNALILLQTLAVELGPVVPVECSGDRLDRHDTQRITGAA